MNLKTSEVFLLMEENLDSNTGTNLNGIKEIFNPTVLLIGGAAVLVGGGAWLFGGKIWNYLTKSKKAEPKEASKTKKSEEIKKPEKKDKGLEIVWRSFTSENLSNHHLTEEHENELPHYIPRYWIPHLKTETGHETPLLYVPEGCEF